MLRENKPRFGKACQKSLAVRLYSADFASGGYERPASSLPLGRRRWLPLGGLAFRRRGLLRRRLRLGRPRRLRRRGLSRGLGRLALALGDQFDRVLQGDRVERDRFGDRRVDPAPIDIGAEASVANGDRPAVVFAEHSP